MKHWRTFGTEEWHHVREGALGLFLGSGLPIVLFYATLRLHSFALAVVVVLLWSAAVFLVHRRRTGGADVFSAATFGFAVAQALIGLVSQDQLLYLAAPSLENLIYGTVFLVTALFGKPLLVLYAERIYPIPLHVQRSSTFRRAFLVTSAVWFGVLIVRASVRLWLLVSLPLEAYLVANAAAGWPFNLFLVTFTVWYPLRKLRRAGLLKADPPLRNVDLALEEAAPGTP